MPSPVVGASGITTVAVIVKVKTLLSTVVAAAGSNFVLSSLDVCVLAPGGVSAGTERSGPFPGVCAAARLGDVNRRINESPGHSFFAVHTAVCSSM